MKLKNQKSTKDFMKFMTDTYGVTFVDVTPQKEKPKLQGSLEQKSGKKVSAKQNYLKAVRSVDEKSL